MRLSFPALCLLLSCLLATHAAAQIQGSGEIRLLATPDVLNSEDGGEVLQVYLPPAWHTVHKEWLDNRGIKEVVPQDQTIINWREMLAFQVIDKVRMPPQAYLDQLRDALRSSCDFSHFQTLAGSVNSRYAEATHISWCGQVAGAAWGEIVLTRIIAGENTLYSLNKSWRTIPFRSVEAIGLPEEEIRYWSTQLNRSRLCDTRRHDC
ncbi:MAG: hypothetical protein ACK4L8_11600 [Nitrincola lacisaponensis]|uniref:hypothetical protein n=1 Tax=Nitrincola lacisaponensis TaxID=267850 RepID=UPI003919468B